MQTQRKQTARASRFGSIYKCIDDKSNIIGVKKIVDSAQEAQLEINILLKLIGKPNILQIIINESLGFPKSSPSDNYFYTEYCNEGSLKDYKKNYDLDDTYKAYIFKQILKGLVYLFDNKIFHSDIKDENILINQTDTAVHIKIGDFGLATDLTGKQTLELKDISLYGGVSVPYYLTFTTYFRDLYGVFKILLNLYCRHSEPVI